MKEVWRRIKSHWNRSDTVVLSTNLGAFALLIGNCWWESINIVYLATLVPLAMQAFRSVKTGGTLRHALIFGALVAWLWPFTEWAFTNTVGWWGSYSVPALALLHTPVYAVLIAWLGATYCVYLSRRVVEMEFSVGAAVVAITVSALGLGVVGENLFVAAEMWGYKESIWRFGAVPAFIPLAYTVSYGAVPFLYRLHVVHQALTVLLLLVTSSVFFGLVTGFFPQP